MKYLLYKNCNKGACESRTTRWEIISITPTLFRYLRGEVTQSDFFWRILSFNRYRLFVVKNEKGDVIHRSACIGKCIKFPFLKKGDFEIGPCYTEDSFRGKGIYPAVLEHILCERVGNYYMLVREDNESSIRGIEKAGFSLVGEVQRDRLGRWKKR